MRIKTLSLILLACIILLLPTGLYAGPWNAIVVPNQTTAEHLATIDLQRYLAQVTGKIPVIMDPDTWQQNPVEAVILGSPSTNEILHKVAVPITKMGEQGFYLTNETIKSVDVVVAAGANSQANVNAVYGLLRQLGYGFFLGSDSAPLTLPDKLEKSIVRNPVFKTRAVLGWYNFLNSPTVWDPIDHRAFVDQLIRSGANLLTFHTYDWEAFGGYIEDGKIQKGYRLGSTSGSVWGTHGMKTDEFAYSTNMLYPEKYFGAESTLIKGSMEMKVDIEQNILRDAFNYAHKRGLSTCLGIEVRFDPMDPEVRRKFIKRLNYILDKYPALDYIALWQPESWGATGFPEKPEQMKEDSFLQNYTKARREYFSRITERQLGVDYPGSWAKFVEGEEGKFLRAQEGARLEQYAMLAYRQFKKRQNSPKVIISGWGGKNYMLSAEYYPGLDKLLPEDIVFSSLDNIATNPLIDTAYADRSEGRQRWPIPSLEKDSDLWSPQPHISDYAEILKQTNQAGCQGVSSIFWRTREPEQTYSYLLSYSWNPDLTVDEFFSDFSKKYYPADIAAKMAKVHKKLDDLGYRWIGGSGQQECHPFDWRPGKGPQVKELEIIRDDIVNMLSQTSSENLSWLLNRMDWVINFDYAQNSAIAAKALLAKADGEDDSNQKKLLAKKAKETLADDRLKKALRAYAKRITTRGEYGVLTAVNAKAVYDWRELHKKIAEILGQPVVELQSDWDGTKDIILPRLITSIAKGDKLELKPVVLGGGKAWLYYRTLGQDKWIIKPLKTIKGWVQTAVVDASAVKTPAIEIAFSFSDNPADGMAFGPRLITVMPNFKVDTFAPATIALSEIIPALNFRAGKGKSVPVELTWNKLYCQADYFNVYRNGQKIVETAVNYCPDFPGDNAAATYFIEAVRGGQVIAKSKEVKIDLKN